MRSSLQAVRSGKWKLHLLRNELYDLDNDIAEQRNVYDDHSEIVVKLTTLADGCRQEPGDARTNTEGSGCQPVGRVENPRTLTSMDQIDPYIRAMYDSDDIEE